MGGGCFLARSWAGHDPPTSFSLTACTSRSCPVPGAGEAGSWAHIGPPCGGSQGGKGPGQGDGVARPGWEGSPSPHKLITQRQ